MSQKKKIDENYLQELIAGGIPERTNVQNTGTDEKENETTGKKEWNTRRKKGMPDYSVFLQPNSNIQERQCVYVRRELQETISLITNILGTKNLTIGGYIDNVLADHFTAYQEEINNLLAKQYPKTIIKNDD